ARVGFSQRLNPTYDGDARHGTERSEAVPAAARPEGSRGDPAVGRGRLAEPERADRVHPAAGAREPRGETGRPRAGGRRRVTATAVVPRFPVWDGPVMATATPTAAPTEN